MVNEIERPDNQSTFASTQAVLQAPPENEADQQKRRSFVKIALIAAAFVLLATALVITTIPKQRSAPLPSPTPAAVSAPAMPPSALDQEIMKVQTDVTQANPEDVLIAPPQVDMEVTF